MLWTRALVFRFEILKNTTYSFSAMLTVFLVGNAFVLVLEGLVVGIQTTRLVLFEFFIRFLRSSGRRFRPLPSPDEPAGAEEATKGHQRRTS